MSTSMHSQIFQERRSPQLTPKDYPTLSKHLARELCRVVNRGPDVHETAEDKKKRQRHQQDAEEKAKLAAVVGYKA